MKTVTILLLLIISLTSFSQNESRQKLLPDNYFLKQLEKEKLPYSFDISSEFQKEIRSLEFDFSTPLPGIQEKKTERRFLNDNTTYFSSRMPVVKGDFHSNMPIAVPDSSVHYFILEKRIQLINPLEK